MKRQLHLLLIDPQNDFCDLPQGYLPAHPISGMACAPALPVPGAHQDMLRVASLIDQGRDGLQAISITLDSHHRYDIAHPTFWRAAGGADVAPFTQITAADVRAERFLPRAPQMLVPALAYLDALETSGRYQLMVWPVHCEIGSWGYNVHQDVRAAYNRWEDAHQAIVAKVVKGSNPMTEHYSAVMAEVPDAGDPDTQLNRALIASLSRADLVYIAGEAGSHCVKATTEHLAEHLDPAKLVLVTDCISPVSGFEQPYREFTQRMQARGVQLAQSAEVLQDLLRNADA
jgi:nicotinamidase/pyrazinamidase